MHENGKRVLSFKSKEQVRKDQRELVARIKAAKRNGCTNCGKKISEYNWSVRVGICTSCKPKVEKEEFDNLLFK